MPDFPLLEGAVIETIGAVAASSRGTLITASATPNTKGAYAQMVASTARHATGIVIIANRHGDANVDYLIDIAAGGAGSEQVILSNLLSTNGPGGDAFGGWWYFPLAIPAGTRISARCQSTGASADVRVTAHLVGAQMQIAPLSKVTTYGANTADSGGTSIDPGASANTKGAWTQLTASSAALAGFALAFGTQANTTRTRCTWLIDIGIGGAGSEQVLLADLLLSTDTSSDNMAPGATPFLPLSIPAGTRIAARAACSITDATDRLFDLVLYGVCS